jgi:hypothetical protein
MKNYRVVKTEKRNNGTIIHHVDEGETHPTQYEYVAVWGGLAWSAEKNPAYYCILGQELLSEEYRSHERLPGKIKFFAEFQAASVLSCHDFFLKLTDALVYYHCTEIYTLKDDEFYSPYVSAYDDYLQEKKLSGVAHLENAPYADNFQGGLTIVNHWLQSGKLELPEGSIVRNQLKTIEDSDLADSPEKKFIAVNALRYVIGAFQKFQPRVYPDDYFSSRRRRGGWMAT